VPQLREKWPFSGQGHFFAPVAILNVFYPAGIGWISFNSVRNAAWKFRIIVEEKASKSISPCLHFLTNNQTEKITPNETFLLPDRRGGNGVVYEWAGHYSDHEIKGKRPRKSLYLFGVQFLHGRVRSSGNSIHHQNMTNRQQIIFGSIRRFCFFDGGRF